MLYHSVMQMVENGDDCHSTVPTAAMQAGVLTKLIDPTLFRDESMRPAILLSEPSL